MATPSEEFAELLEELFNDIVNASNSDLYFTNKATKQFLKLANTQNIFDSVETRLVTSTKDSFLAVIHEMYGIKELPVAFSEKKRRLSLEVVLILVIAAITKDLPETSLLIQLFKEKFDLKYAVFCCLFTLIRIIEREEKEIQSIPFYLAYLKSQNKNEFLSKIFLFIKKLEGKRVSSKEIKEKDQYLVQNIKFISVKAYNSVIQQVWLRFCKSKLVTEQLLLNLLSYVTKHVLQTVEDPVLFSDFYSSCFNADSAVFDVMIPILAFEGQFLLITQYGLEYPEFYKRLYSLCQSNIDSSNLIGCFRFFQLVDISLSSEYLATNLICSFAKILLRKAITSTPTVIMLTIVLIHNIIIRHPSCLRLINCSNHKNMKENDNLNETFKKREEFFNEIKQKTKEIVEKLNKFKKTAENSTDKVVEKLFNSNLIEENLKINDDFNMFEEDPLKTKAENSYLWELELLKNHYSISVKRLVDNIIFKEFSKTVETKRFQPIIELRRYKELNFDSLFEKEISYLRKANNDDFAIRKKFKVAPLAIFDSKHNFKEAYKSCLLKL